MADKFWVAGTGNWSDATTHWALTSGGLPGVGNLPTASDDVYFDTLSNATAYTVTIDATTKLCNNLTFAAPLTSGNVTWAGSVAMTVSGNLVCYAGLIASYTGTITFNATSTGKTVTTATTSLACPLVFAGVGGGWTLQDTLTSTKSITVTDGTFATGNNTFTCLTFNSSAATARTLTFGSSTINITGNNAIVWSTNTNTNLTCTANTSTVNFTYSGATGSRQISNGSVSSVNLFYNVNVSAGTDTVFFNNLYVGNNFLWTGFAGTWSGSSAWTLMGSLTAAVGMTITMSSTITFSATATGKTVDMKSIAFAFPLTFDGVGGGWTFLGTINPTGQNITLTNGALDMNGQTVGSTNISSSNSNIRSLTLGAATLNINAWNTTINTNLTFSGASATINVAGTDGNILGPAAATGLTFGTVNVALAGTWTTSGRNTFATLTVTKTAATDAGQWQFSDDQTVSGTLTIAGANASTRRLFMNGGSRTLNRIVTAATVVASNVDLRFLTGAGAGSWDLSAITGGSGNCGGCSGITFTPAANQFYQTGASGSFSTTANWFLATNGGGGAGRVPLPQDMAIFDASSITAGSVVITQDMTRIGGMNWTGVTNTPTLTTSTACDFHGSITLVAGMTLTASTEVYNARCYTACTIDCGTKTWAKQIVVRVNESTGSLTLSGHFLSTANVTLVNGTFAGSSFNLTALTYVQSSSLDRTLNMGSGTWTLTQSSGTPWSSATTTLLNFNAGTSTIIINDTGATSKTFAGGGLTYNNFTASGDNVIVTGANTFATLAVNNAGLTTGLTLPASTTTTVTSFTTNGFASNLAKLISSSNGVAATLSKPGGGQISVDYMSIKDSAIGTISSWFAGANSTSVSGNTGWRFTAPTVKTMLGLAMGSIKTVTALNQGLVKTLNDLAL